MDYASDMILLLDHFSEESKNLYESFCHAGIDIPTAVIEDDGFLPEGVISAYGFFLQEKDAASFSPVSSENVEGKNSNEIHATDAETTANIRNEIGVWVKRPRYFNEIDIPSYWRIEGTNRDAKVMDHDREAARLFYREPRQERIVKAADWVDASNKVRLTEHYNRFGEIFCRTIFDGNGKKIVRKFYTGTGKERIAENFVTGDIWLNYEGRDHIFHNKTAFVQFFLECAGFANHRMLYDSLSFPFFVSQSRADTKKNDILFWHEPIQNGIPGNMQIILDKEKSHTSCIYVTKKQSYESLLALGASQKIVKQLGYVYHFKRENGHRGDALICTNSERVAHLRELAKLVPKMRFHVAAFTEMSQALMRIGQESNVFLYPNVKPKLLAELFGKCDYYLDINYEGEMADAVHRAFLENQLIVAFEETMHNKAYIAPTNVFSETEYQDLAEALRMALRTPTLVDAAVEKQREAALSVTGDRLSALLPSDNLQKPSALLE